jgi:hypothetical protein
MEHGPEYMAYFQMRDSYLRAWSRRGTPTAVNTHNAACPHTHCPHTYLLHDAEYRRVVGGVVLGPEVVQAEEAYEAKQLQQPQ